MNKAFVRFGEIEDPNRTEVYEAIVEGNVVKILMPKASHPAAVQFAKSIGFGDVDTYLVDGEFIGTDDTSRSLLSKTKVLQKLFYDRTLQTYLIENVEAIEEQKNNSPMAKFANKHPDKSRLKEMKNHYEAGKDRAYQEMGGWHMFLALFFCRWPKFLKPKSVR